MRPSSIAAAAVLALLASAAPASAADVLYVGDSLGVGTMPRLAQSLQGDRVGGDNRVGRPSPEALSVLARLYSPSADVVVFDAGTNDDPSQPARLSANLARARDLSGTSCLVVATLNRPPLNGVSIAGMNRAVRSFATQTPGVQLVEWNEAVALQPDLLGPDRVHPTPAGYGVRAQMFAEAISSCGSAAAATPRAAPDNPDAPARVKRKRRPAREIPVPGIESSGISFTEPISFRSRGATVRGDVLLPPVKPPYRAVVLIPAPGGPPRSAYRQQAEAFASNGLAALMYDPAGASVADAAADTRAAVHALARRRDVRGRVALWARGDAGLVAPVAAGDGAVAAIVLSSASAVDAASRRDWAVREALGGGGHPVTSWFRVKSRVGDDDFDPVPWWRRVAQPVLATWDTRSRQVPNRASAAALREALAAGPNRDRSFEWAPGGGTVDDAVAWLGPRLVGKAKPVVRTGLPPANGAAQPVNVHNASGLYSAPLQLAWLLVPALIMAWCVVRRRSRRAAAVAVVDLAALAAIAGGVALVVSADGVGVAKVAGLPILFALAWLLVAAGTAATFALARARGALPAIASAAWLGLALFWLV